MDEIQSTCCLCMNNDGFNLIKLKKEGFSWFFLWLVCEFKSSPCESQCKPCTNIMDTFLNYFEKCYHCETFKDCQNFILSPIAFLCVVCCFAPILLCIFVNLIIGAIFLVFYCPPLAILTSAMPCLRSRESEVYFFLEKEPEERADPSSQGHVTLWHEIGWVRAFFLCCLLTCFGFFPGVFFAGSVAIHHVLKYMRVSS
jgi:hypothetical protein